jgi:hypothetical protein
MQILDYCEATTLASTAEIEHYKEDASNELGLRVNVIPKNVNLGFGIRCVAGLARAYGLGKNTCLYKSVEKGPNGNLAPRLGTTVVLFMEEKVLQGTWQADGTAYATKLLVDKILLRLRSDRELQRRLAAAALRWMPQDWGDVAWRQLLVEVAGERWADERVGSADLSVESAGQGGSGVGGSTSRGMAGRSGEAGEVRSAAATPLRRSTRHFGSG